jgi:hypothetical protein
VPEETGTGETSATETTVSSTTLSTTIGGSDDDSAGSLDATRGATDATTEIGEDAGDATTAANGSTGEPSARVTDGVLVLYLFNASAGTVVSDASAVEPSIDLLLEGGGFMWTGTGLATDGSGIGSAQGSSSKIRQACQATNALTVEAWVTPALAVQSGPARIVTYSLDPSFRNFTLGQSYDEVGMASKIAGRLRTTDTNVNGGPDLVVPYDFGTEPIHLVYTRDPLGVEVIYADATVVGVGTRSGDFSNWDSSLEYRFAIGNERTLDRPWLGEFHLVAVYDHALDSSEVIQNFAAGY